MILNKSTLVLLFISICLTPMGSLVTKHKPRTAQKAIVNQKGSDDEIVKEKYTPGICKESPDDLTLYNQSYGQCITECRYRSQCSAINFCVKLGVCRLNFRTDITEKSCPKYIFSEKINWKQKSIPGCEKQTCPNSHKCVMSKRNPVCKATSCENIHFITNGVVFGNHVAIGESRGFRCAEGFKLIGSRKITCLTDGKWSDSVPVCEAINTSTTTTQANNIVNHGKQTNKSTDNVTLTTTALRTQTTNGSTSWTYITVMMSSASVSPIDNGALNGVMYHQNCNELNICYEEHQECREGKCRCVFGFVYNLLTTSCVQGCERLGTSYQEYNMAKTDDGLGKNHSLSVASPRECLEHCNNNLMCTFLTVTKISEYNLTCRLFDSFLVDMRKSFDPDSITFVRDCSHRSSENGDSSDDSTSNNGLYKSNKSPSTTDENLDQSNDDMIDSTTSGMHNDYGTLSSDDDIDQDWPESTTKVTNHNKEAYPNTPKQTEDDFNKTDKENSINMAAESRNDSITNKTTTASLINGGGSNVHKDKATALPTTTNTSSSTTTALSKTQADTSASTVSTTTTTDSDDTLEISNFISSRDCILGHIYSYSKDLCMRDGCTCSELTTHLYLWATACLPFCLRALSSKNGSVGLRNNRLFNNGIFRYWKYGNCVCKDKFTSN